MHLHFPVVVISDPCVRNFVLCFSDLFFVIYHAGRKFVSSKRAIVTRNVCVKHFVASKNNTLQNVWRVRGAIASFRAENSQKPEQLQINFVTSPDKIDAQGKFDGISLFTSVSNDLVATKCQRIPWKHRQDVAARLTPGLTAAIIGFLASTLGQSRERQFLQVFSVPRGPVFHWNISIGRALSYYGTLHTVSADLPSLI